jgi:ubiquinone/menaquinone biosynthesis C-methylase UbiE
MKTFDNTWEQIHEANEWGRYPSEEVVRFVARNYYKADRKSIKILDLGCGAGANTWYLAKEGFDVYAVDGSNSAITKTNNLLKSMNLSANLFVCDVAHLPFSEEYFDVIIDCACIYSNTIFGIKEIIQECYRVLKYHGKIFSTGNFSPDTTGFGRGNEIENNTYKDITDGVLAGRGIAHFFTQNELESLYARLKNVIVDYATRTDGGGEMKIAYYILQGTK